ncbi:beta-galactosidase [Cellulomonas soli]|uniref:beta-galactosidase n=1 Tax=Cellulomonas soli TaxID=931535 RepID=A0A512P8L0_9CELL|nr:beta-galactosidase [Cellulomonas soli]NYI57693.1 beta-galactosidase [Cellulomonas soli]GEP67472.1 beta-galactosidase [Cellulomonas soli]
MTFPDAAHPSITDRVLFGAAYYPEYAAPGAEPLDPQRAPDRVLRDLDLMAAAGFTAIRVGESVWSTWEPEDGRFDLDWLAPTLDAAHERGIAAVLGTPTYAVPPWLARRYPEIAGDTATGRRMPWGSRQEVDFTHAAFRHHAERVIRAVVGRYLDHPAVIGYQVDNEPGIRLLSNEGVFQRFVDELRHRHVTVERLNEEWGLTYWSHRLSTWADLWRPDGNLQPEYDLAWRRFQAGLVTEMIGWQADLVRTLVHPTHPERFVTTCLSFDQLGVADVPLSEHLEITAGNAYYRMADSLAHPATTPMSPDWIVEGTWGVYQLADLMYSAKQAPFLVTETNAASIGHGSTNSVAYDGQWRQAAWALVSRGARMVEYWHWHTLHHGTETYWGGVLPHDGLPGRAYLEMARLGAELAAAGPVVARSTPDADVAFLYSSDAKWALGFATQAPLPAANGWGDADAYRRLTLPFYRGAFDAGLQVGTVRPEQLFGDLTDTDDAPPPTDPAELAAQRPVLVAVGLYTARDRDLDWLCAYAAAGGHLIIGPRTGYGDEAGRARTDVKPARLDEAAGVSYQEYANLLEPTPVLAPDLGDGPFVATAWSDYLRPDDADVLARYEHPHLGRWPAVTTRAHGDGRITVVGTVPGQDLARALLAWACPAPLHGWPDLPADVRVTTSTADDGRRIAYVHHWGWGDAVVTTPVDLVDATDPAVRIAAGSTLTLGPWDVRVLVGEPTTRQENR